MGRSHRLTVIGPCVVLAIAVSLVAPSAWAQLNQPLHRDGWILADGSGAFGDISVVDNATNDAYFVRGIKTMELPAP